MTTLFSPRRSIVLRNFYPRSIFRPTTWRIVYHRFDSFEEPRFGWEWIHNDNDGGKLNGLTFVFFGWMVMIYRRKR